MKILVVRTIPNKEELEKAVNLHNVWHSFKTRVGNFARQMRSGFNKQNIVPTSEQPTNIGEPTPEDLADDVADASTQVKLHPRCECSLERRGNMIVWRLGSNPCTECTRRAENFNSKWNPETALPELENEMGAHVADRPTN